MKHLRARLEATWAAFLLQDADVDVSAEVTPTPLSRFRCEQYACDEKGVVRVTDRVYTLRFEADSSYFCSAHVPEAAGWKPA